MSIIQQNGKRELAIEINQFNGNEEVEGFHQMMTDIFKTTIKQRFNYSTFYRDIVAVTNPIRQSKYRVFLAVKNKTNERIALKVKKVYTQNKSAEHVKREFEMAMFEVYFCKKMCTVYHPNIVQLTNAWAIERFHEIYIEMEQCDGTLESAIMKSKRRMPLNLIQRYMYHILSALKYCHANRVIHGDVKEDNVLILKGVAKLCDFDMARETSPEGTIPFTDSINDRRYLSLELLLGLDMISTAVDIYSTGCILVHMTCGATQLLETMDRQHQLNAMHQYAGPIDAWYFNNGRNPNSLQNPVELSLPVLGFLKAFPFIAEYDDNGLMADLLRRLFEFDQVKRINAHAAINHPFFYM